MTHLFLFDCVPESLSPRKFAIPAKSQDEARAKLAAFLPDHPLLPQNVIHDWRLSIAGRVATDIFVL